LTDAGQPLRTAGVTVAVCLKCGAFKHGAWTPCPACDYCPDDDESYTKHLLVSDHYLSRDKLEEASRFVRSGAPLDFPPELLKGAWVSKASVDREGRRLALGCTAAIVAAVLLAGGIAFLALR
jgi:hypothetical protein